MPQLHVGSAGGADWSHFFERWAHRGLRARTHARRAHAYAPGMRASRNGGAHARARSTRTARRRPRCEACAGFCRHLHFGPMGSIWIPQLMRNRLGNRYRGCPVVGTRFSVPSLGAGFRSWHPLVPSTERQFADALRALTVCPLSLACRTLRDRALKRAAFSKVDDSRPARSGLPRLRVSTWQPSRSLAGCARRHPASNRS